MSIIMSIVAFFTGLATVIISIIRDNTADSRIPDEVIRDLARLFLPKILEMVSTDEGRAELERWRVEQANAAEPKKRG